MFAEKSTIKVKCPCCKTEFPYLIPVKLSRTNKQNRYMWGVVYQILSEETGYSREEIHEAMKQLFLKKEILVKGVLLESTASTTELKTDNMEMYLENIRRWSSMTLGVNIPTPNECEYDG